jgi:translation initiation factor 2 alpha subunit (eIF-2alpha)
MNVKVNELVMVRVTDVTDRVLVRLLNSDQQGVILPGDITRRGNFRTFVRVDRNEVARVKSIEDGIVYLSKNTVSPEEIYRVESQLYRCPRGPLNFKN